jgi:hypothetical protein
MTGFDPTAPDRDTDKDEPEKFPDNVVPPETLIEDDTDDSPAPTDD